MIGNKERFYGFIYRKTLSSVSFYLQEEKKFSGSEIAVLPCFEGYRENLTKAIRQNQSLGEGMAFRIAFPGKVRAVLRWRYQCCE